MTGISGLIPEIPVVFEPENQFSEVSKEIKGENHITGYKFL